METLESSLSLLMQQAHPLEAVETLPLLSALGRVAAANVTSPMQTPPFDRSPLDGYALHSEDIAGASREQPARLRVIGEACAGCGERFHPARGEALRVMTGAPVPAECDCVIRQEDTNEGMTTAEIYAPVRSGMNICRAGEDVALGAEILAQGDVITSAHIGVLASLGITELTVFRRVRAALLCTGDELCQPGQALPFGKIYDSNRAAFSARLAELGCELCVCASLPDDPAQASAALREAAAKVDLLLTTGGVSVGKKDIMHQVLPLLGAQRLFWKVAMKPGSPLLCALAEGKLLICLSGNPFAALCCFEVFAVPVLRRIGGMRECAHRRFKAVLKGSFPRSSPGRRLVRAVCEGGTVRLTGSNHSSGSLATMIGCNCLIDLPAGTGALQGGEEVEVMAL